MSNHSKKQKGIKIKEANLEICVNNDISNKDFDEYFQRCIHRKQEREFELSEKEYYDIFTFHSFVLVTAVNARDVEISPLLIRFPIFKRFIITLLLLFSPLSICFDNYLF